MAYKCLKLAISCINHAFRVRFYLLLWYQVLIWFVMQLNCILNMEITPEDKMCLDEFSSLRSKWMYDIQLAVNEDDIPHYQTHQIEELDTHELLISEVIPALHFTLYS